MARGGRGRRNTGGRGFAGGVDQVLPSGRVRTAAGGTRNRGGGLATTASGRAARSAQRQTRIRQSLLDDIGLAGIPGNRVLVTPPGARGGALARGGTSGLKRTSNDPYRGSSSELVVGSQAGARGTRRRRRTATAAPTAGGRDPNRRANAIRNLAQRGATPGERAAARAAAQRLGI